MATAVESTPVVENELAINGGPKAVPSVESYTRRKIDVEEFMELADLWGFNEDTKATIAAAIAQDDFAEPLLARYYNPRPSKVLAMEELARELFEVPYALGVNSGTSALNTAYTALGLGPGDEVIIPAYTFFATIAAVVTVGAIPVIAEIDDTLTIDPKDVEKKITPRTRAIVPVHIGGQCCDMDAIMDIARRHNLRVVEDTAQACGGTYKGRKLGTIGDFGCFSLSSYKIVGAGEAGLVLCKDEFLYTRAQNNHDTGACWRPDRFATEQEEGELFCGYNYKMSELEGACNLAQLRKMPGYVADWQRASGRIRAQLERFEGITPQRFPDPNGTVGYNIYFFAADAASAGKIAEALVAEGIGASARGGKTTRDWHIYAYWEHILKQKSASASGHPWTHPLNAPHLPEYSPDMCPRTLDLMSRVVTIGVDRSWSDNDCDRVAAGINKVLGAYYTRTNA